MFLEVLGSMGIILNKFTEVADPVTTLLPSQHEMIRNTFVLLRKDEKAYGEALYLLYFKKFPEYQLLFRDFKDVEYEWLKGNAKLQVHGLTVLSAISNLVDNLDNAGVLLSLLAKLGSNHDRHGVTEQSVWDLKDTFLELMHTELGKKLTPKAAEAWSKLLTVSFGVVVNELSRRNE